MADHYVFGDAEVQGHWKESAILAGYSMIPQREGARGLQIIRRIEQIGGTYREPVEPTPETEEKLLDPVEAQELENLLAEALLATEEGDESALDQVETLARRYRALGLSGKIQMPASRVRLISDAIREAELRRAKSIAPEDNRKKPAVLILPTLGEAGEMHIPKHILAIYETPEERRLRLKLEPEANADPLGS